MEQIALSEHAPLPSARLHEATGGSRQPRAGLRPRPRAERRLVQTTPYPAPHARHNTAGRYIRHAAAALPHAIHPQEAWQGGWQASSDRSKLHRGGSNTERLAGGFARIDWLQSLPYGPQACTMVIFLM